MYVARAYKLAKILVRVNVHLYLEKHIPIRTSKARHPQSYRNDNSLRQSHKKAIISIPSVTMEMATTLTGMLPSLAPRWTGPSIRALKQDLITKSGNNKIEKHAFPPIARAWIYWHDNAVSFICTHRGIVQHSMDRLCRPGAPSSDRPFNEYSEAD